MHLEINDINFGIKKWYLQPTFFIKIGSALFSFILMIVLFVVISRSSDSIWKNSIGRSECFCLMFLALLLLITVVCFLFYFYKIYPDYSIYFFFVSVGALILYAIFLFISILSFCTKGKCTKFTEKFITYCKENSDKSCVVKFLSKYKTDVSSTDFNSICENYSKGRTTKTSSLLMPFSFIWIILVVLLFFIVLFEGKDDDERSNSNVMPLRPNVDA